jgi:hypothetical protein
MPLHRVGTNQAATKTPAFPVRQSAAVWIIWQRSCKFGSGFTSGTGLAAVDFLAAPAAAPLTETRLGALPARFLLIF